MDSNAHTASHKDRLPQLLLPDLPQDLGLHWRAMRLDDLSSLASLIGVIEEADRTPFRTGEEELRAVFVGVNTESIKESIAAFTPEGTPVAYGILQVTQEEDAHRVFLDGGVHPDAREVGLGQAIVDWLTAKSVEILRELPPKAHASISAFLQDDAEHNWRLFEQAGYLARRYHMALRRDTRLPVEPVQLSEGFAIVPWSEQLDDAIREAHNDAFRDHFGFLEYSSERWAQERPQLEGSWSFAVIQRDVDSTSFDVVGYILCSRLEEAWAHDQPVSGYIEMLGVRRAYRGQRVALALLTRVIETLAAHGVYRVELDVDTDTVSSGVGIYSHLGFEVVHGSRMYSLEF